MVQLYDNQTGEMIGAITDQQLQFLRDQLEEESMEDQDYAIEAMTLAYFIEQGIDAELLGLLRKALGEKDQIIIRWAEK
jgi:processive 1,2-diacylglycerol beta-glucosyltransferase